jgi:hypothetical protein
VPIFSLNISRWILHCQARPDEDILSDAFAREWSDVQAKGPERLEQQRVAGQNAPCRKIYILKNQFVIV